MPQTGKMTFKAQNFPISYTHCLEKTITEHEAMQMLESTKSYALLTGARGQAGMDIRAIATSLQRISQLVTDFPEIAEMDINPFMVRPPGSLSVAADARITLARPG